MQAIELEGAGSPLKVVNKPKPRPRPDGVVIQMKAAPILSYMQGVVSGELPYMLPRGAFTPGSDVIGTVAAVGAEVFDLAPGTLVHARPHIASRGFTGETDDILIGLTGMAPASERVQRIWPDGAFAEYVHYPVDCITPLDPLAHLPAARLAALMFLAVPYGGFLSMGLKAGQSVIIGGATGNFGAHAVLVALAMGASRVVPVGRKRSLLDQLRERDPERVFPSVLTGDVERDTASIVAAAEGLPDGYLDITGGGGTEPVLACIRALKKKGEIVLMGALQEAIQIPYVEIMVRGLTIRGNFMYPPHAPGDLARMIAAGRIDLSDLQIQTYPLGEAAAAIEAAAGMGGLSFNVLSGR
ncbi:MAG: zinc-binding dehydrogenase [Desulfosarcinaceae bacterium]|nr:zinc-binding dehydrogenase [Desulfosarcinaceae bacterium]